MATAGMEKNVTEARVLITGSGGFIGQRLLRVLASDYPSMHVLATARRKPALDFLDDPDCNIHYLQLDVRDAQAAEILRRERIDTVVHMASVVTPGPGMDRAIMYDIDVNGTRNMLDACLTAGVKKIIVTTSAASYGYHADNPVPLTEDAPLRGNVEFPYSDHKRLIEEMLAEYRQQHPQLAQLVFRPGFILGPDCDNQITALFDKPVITGMRGTDTPFTIIWDEDVARCIIEGIVTDKTGIYNQTGDGIVTLREMARMLGKPFIALPVPLVQGLLWLLKRSGISQYGPEQVKFLRYRPVLSNQALKNDFSYSLQKTSLQCFTSYCRARGILRHAPAE